MRLMPRRPSGKSHTKVNQNSCAVILIKKDLKNPTLRNALVAAVYRAAPVKKPPELENDDRTVAQERKARPMIQKSFPARNGLWASHQAKTKTTAKGAKVSFERLPGIAQSGRRYQREDKSDHVIKARKNASPEST